MEDVEAFQDAQVAPSGRQRLKGSPAPDSETPVTLVIPNDRSYLRVVRLVVASLAADAGFDFEEIEDLRTAADELVNLVMSGSTPDAAIRLHVVVDDHVLSIRSTGDAKSDDVLDSLDTLGLYIVRALAGAFDMAVVDGRLDAGFEIGPPERLRNG